MTLWLFGISLCCAAVCAAQKPKSIAEAIVDSFAIIAGFAAAAVAIWLRKLGA